MHLFLQSHVSPSHFGSLRKRWSWYLMLQGASVLIEFLICCFLISDCINFCGFDLSLELQDKWASNSIWCPIPLTCGVKVLVGRKHSPQMHVLVPHGAWVLLFAIFLIDILLWLIWGRRVFSVCFKYNLESSQWDISEVNSPNQRDGTFSLDVGLFWSYISIFL